MKRVQFIRYVEVISDTFTGFEGELTVNLSNKTLRVHDGVTKGGFELASVSLSNTPNATQQAAGKMTVAHVVELSAATSLLSSLDQLLTQEIFDRTQGDLAISLDVSANTDAIGIETSARISADQGLSSDIADLTLVVNAIDQGTVSVTGAQTITGAKTYTASVAQQAKHNYFGVNDDTQALLHLYGDGTGSSAGGALRLYAASDHNTAHDYWSVYVWNETLRFHPVGGAILELSATGVTYDSFSLYHQGNDGINSGLDADLGHGVSFSSYARTDISEVFLANLSCQGNMFANNGRVICNAFADDAITLYRDVNSLREGDCGWFSGSDSMRFRRFDTAGLSVENEVILDPYGNVTLGTKNNAGTVFLKAATIACGINDSRRGRLQLFGAGANNTAGGRLEMYPSASYDSVTNRWIFETNEAALSLHTDAAVSLLLNTGEKICVAEQAHVITGKWEHYVPETGWAEAGVSYVTRPAGGYFEVYFGLPITYTAPAGARSLVFNIKLLLRSLNTPSIHVAAASSIHNDGTNVFTKVIAEASTFEYVAQVGGTQVLVTTTLAIIPVGADGTCQISFHATTGGPHNCYVQLVGAIY